LTSSLNFDRAADFYDATRTLPADASRRLTDALEREVRSVGGRVLEVGVGTGRIARPLLARGISLTGVDISSRMMAKFLEQLPNGTQAELLLGDATCLPFAAGSFPAVLSSHVLHLVSSLDGALLEVRRVLTPDGIFLNTHRRYPEPSAYSVHGDKWDQLLARFGVARRRYPGEEEIPDALRAMGGRLRSDVVAAWDSTETLEALLHETRSRTHSWSWEIPDDVFAECLREYELWARANLPPRDTVRIVQQMDVWTFQQQASSAQVQVSS